MSHFKVKFEVFEPYTQDSTLRIGIPVEVLRALVENGIGQFHVSDDKLQDCCGVRAVFVEAVRDHQAVGAVEVLQPLLSAHGQPKYEGWLGADAGSAWWETREGRYLQKREQYAVAVTVDMPIGSKYAMQEMLKAAYDAGAGRKKE